MSADYNRLFQPFDGPEGAPDQDDSAGKPAPSSNGHPVAPVGRHARRDRRNDVTAQPPATRASIAQRPTDRIAVAQPGPAATKPPAVEAFTGPAKRVPKPVSRQGWRRWLHKLTRINPGLSPDEKHEIALRTRIRRSPRGAYDIGVLGLKGGAGKTVLTAALGSVFAQVRGDRILVVDADPVSGNLAERVGRQTNSSIVDLLAGNRLASYNDIRAHTSANAVKLEVLATEEYGASQRRLSDDDWRGALEAVSGFYNLVLTDCGNGLPDRAIRGLLTTMSGVVIVTGASVDSARQAAVVIDWMQRNGFRDLLNRACVVITHLVPAESDAVASDLVGRLGRHVRSDRIVVLPWDRHIAAGVEIQLEELGGAYTRKILELAAALSDDFDEAAIR
ncbi:MinD/ParA family ATP-binding protein [Mycolicibacterium sphagni]|uniref:MinD/ParA family protein n=1 Tax=Mycolicibacterium sphagni TaxID=1786 RepID=A0ABX2JSK5_9MYCO|nr:MinD/ParA family protein [Mycolicibacterium sphagni]NTY60698.1 MinD/ParA family protein [Mycolicibacterium sphagni]